MSITNILFIVLASYGLVVLYWLIGALVSFADIRIRTWLINHPRWKITPPTGIKPGIVTALWVIYIPIIAVRILGWLFGSGTTILHKILNDALDGVKVERQ